ncbi:exosortase/archaeosortase family protein [Sphingomonas bacterium]|uniref:exosortase/archaeosortase family protein n=1 Tax=Sphingomonas bacterium TaxID=1895847 RepID=UPI0015752610|nr:exosortase/archaeosortase family protein [Sphingomonas bacterium]
MKAIEGAAKGTALPIGDARDPASMTAILDARRWTPALLILAVALPVVPTLIALRDVFWSDESGSQSPIIILGVLYAIWQARGVFGFDQAPRIVTTGTAIFALGCLVYFFGRIQSFYQLQALSWLLLGLGAALVAGGWAAARAIAVPLLVLLLAIPIPGSVADDLLVPVKLFLSRLVVSIMHHFGLPVANQGTIISVGYVQLRIADACAGLQSLVSLTAICLLGNYLVPLRTRTANIVASLMAVPIAFAANLLRLSLLILIAYAWGTNAVLSAHDYAAYLEVAISIGLLSLVHIAVDRIFAPRPSEHHARAA